MKQFLSVCSGFILISLFSVMPTFAEKTKALIPSGTVTLSTKSIAVGIGINWGTGMLTIKGNGYPFSVKGLSVMDLGISKASARGEVYYLRNISDFAGKYASAEVGFALGKGGAGLVMKNTNGVVIALEAVTKGVQLTIGGKGLSIKLSK